MTDALAVMPERTPMEQLLYSLDNPPPYQIGDTPIEMMPVLISDARRVHRRYEAEMLAAGWRIGEIYGCDIHRPWGRIDKAGVVWLLRDARIVSITGDCIVTENDATRNRLMIYRRR